jgi:hypothetical protein
VSAHLELSGRVVVAAAPADAFRFFTPEGERLWIPEWDPEYLHPPDGALAEGLVFRTRHGGEETLWLVSHCDRAAGAVEYVRVTPESRIGTVSVRLSAAGEGATEATITYRLTSLSPAGDRTLAAFEAGFPRMLADWETRIGYAMKLVPPKPRAKADGDAS